MIQHLPRPASVRALLVTASLAGLLGGCATGPAPKAWPPTLSIQPITPEVKDLRRYFAADHLHGVIREYRSLSLGKVKSSYERYEVSQTAGQKVLTTYYVDSLQDRRPSQNARRYGLDDTGVRLLGFQEEGGKTKVLADLVFSWSPDAKPFVQYETESELSTSIMLMPVAGTIRQGVEGTFDGYFHVTGANGAAFDCVRLLLVGKGQIAVNDGMPANASAQRHLYYGLDFGRLVDVTTEGVGDAPKEYGEAAAVLIDARTP